MDAGALSQQPARSRLSVRIPPAQVRRQLMGTLTRLTAVGLIAIGLSGLLAWGAGLAISKGFVSGDPPDIAYTASRCADYFEYEPHARSCAEAATLHHFGEVVSSRMAAGVLGLLLLGAYGLLRRRWTWLADRSALPAGFEATMGMTAFGLASAGLAGVAFQFFVIGPEAGAGAYASAALISIFVALWFGLSLLRTLNGRAPRGA